MAKGRFGDGTLCWISRGAVSLLYSCGPAVWESGKSGMMSERMNEDTKEPAGKMGRTARRHRESVWERVDRVLTG